MAQKFFTYGPDNVGTLLSTTLSQYAQTKLEDNVFNAMPFLAEMNKRKKSFDGGASIVVPLMFEANETSTWYNMYDILDTTPQNGFTSAQAKWKNLATSVSIAGEEARQNSGKNRISSLLEGKIKQAEMSIRNQLTNALFAATTASKKIEALAVMMDATSTIQDINSTNNSWWQADVTTGVGAFATNGLSAMRTSWTNVSNRQPSGTPNIIVTTPAVFNAFEASLTSQARYSTTDSTAQATFENLRFKTASVFHDTACTSGTMYMFPSDNLYFAVNSNADMKQTEFVKPSNQDAMVAQIIVMIQLVTNARRKLAKLTGITTA